MRALTPLLLRSSGGRVGTSLMMELLGTADEIVFDKRHPYESRVLSYFFRLSRLPFTAKSAAIPWENDSLLRAEQNFMGPLPLETQILGNAQDASVEIFHHLWRSVSSLIMYNYPMAKYYAEKIPHDIPDKLQGSFDFKLIFLIRDPRDELLSIIDFNEKRGMSGFGWREGEDVLSYLQRFLLQRKRYLSLIRKNPYEGKVIRYEDMIFQKNKVLQVLSAYLDVDLEGSATRFNIEPRGGHMTSSAPELSVGRWKNSLPREVADRIIDELGTDLEQFGYS